MVLVLQVESVVQGISAQCASRFGVDLLYAHGFHLIFAVSVVDRHFGVAEEDGVEGWEPANVTDGLTSPPPVRVCHPRSLFIHSAVGFDGVFVSPIPIFLLFVASLVLSSSSFFFFSLFLPAPGAGPLALLRPGRDRHLASDPAGFNLHFLLTPATIVLGARLLFGAFLLLRCD